jgi:hypothetical protein
MLAAGYVDGVCKKASAAVCPANTTDAGGDVCTMNCMTAVDSACPGSQICEGFLADPPACTIGFGCRGNVDCAAGHTCDPGSGTCVTAPVGTDPIGSACGAGSSCSGGTCINPTGGAPDGYCTAFCQRLPDLSNTCPSGATCVLRNRNIGILPLGIGADGFCYDLCDASGTVSKFGTCRANYTCSPVLADPRFGICVPS